MAPQPVRPTGHRDTAELRRLATPHALSSAGDTMVTVALAGSLFFSISPTAARGKVALYLALTLAPFAVLAPFLGAVIDRAPGGRRLVMVTVAAGRAVVCVLMARDLHRLLLFPEAFALLVLSKAHAVAKSALVPAVVGEDEFVRANGTLAVAAIAAGAVVAPPAALFVHFEASAWLLRLGAAIFAVCALSGLRLPRPARSRRGSEPDDAAALRAGTGSLAPVARSMAALRASLGFFTFLAAFELRRIDAPAWWFGAVVVATTAGTLAGNVMGPRLSRALSERGALLVANGLVVAGGAAAWWRAGRSFALLLAAVLGFGASAGKLAFDSLVQRWVPQRERARRFARYEAAFQLAWVAGALLPVAVAIPLRAGYLVIAAAGLTAFAAALSSRRGYRTRTRSPRRESS